MIHYATYFALLIFITYLTYYFFVGVMNPVPALGDSWDYHIPIAQSLLDGKFITAAHATIPQHYYPGASEMFTALFIFLHIPLTLSNLFAILLLGAVCWELARTFRLDIYYALFFALTITTMTSIVRWFNAVSIDIWVAIFFCLAIIFLEKPQKTRRYFLFLGIIFGMLIGSKYLAILYMAILAILYGKHLLPLLTIQRIVLFAIPFSLLGVFWYVRNALVVGNPFYPICLFQLPCQEIFHTTVLSVGLAFPIEMFNAVFGEYKFWMFAPLFLLFWFIKDKGSKKRAYGIEKLSIIGGIILLCYLFFPTSHEPWIMVSSLRYSYPAVIPLLLAVFLIAKQTKKEPLLIFLSLAQMIPTLSMAYYPKLLFFSLPLTALALYLLKRHDRLSKK